MVKMSRDGVRPCLLAGDSALFDAVKPGGVLVHSKN
jgi:hypothetical protein